MNLSRQAGYYPDLTLMVSKRKLGGGGVASDDLERHRRLIRIQPAGLGSAFGKKGYGHADSFLTPRSTGGFHGRQEQEEKSAKARAKEPAAQIVPQNPPAAPEPVADVTPVEIPLVTAPPEVVKANMANLVASSLPKVEHFTVEERVSMGKAVRTQAPLESHAEWSPSPYRVDPVTLLEEQAETRVPELVPIRYGRMMVSPFAFYRGAAYVMASDLASTPRSGLRVQACGDAHLMNFGVFASPERTLMFDMNDFDETLPGPWEWDVKRLAVSFEVAARARGFADKDRRSLVLAGGAFLPRDHARLRRDEEPGGLVRQAGH